MILVTLNLYEAENTEEGIELDEGNWMLHLNAEADANHLLEALGDIKEGIKFLNKIEGALKEMLPSKFDSDEWDYTSDHYQAVRSSGAQVRLDTDKIREEMDESWIQNHSKVIPFYQIKVTKVKT